MPNPQDEDARFGVFYSRDHAMVADPISPKFTESVAFQRLTDRTRIFERGDTVTKEAKHTPGGL
jgi:hypothetical protein